MQEGHLRQVLEISFFKMPFCDYVSQSLVKNCRPSVNLIYFLRPALPPAKTMIKVFLQCFK